MFNLVKGLLAVTLGVGGVGAIVYGSTPKKSSNNWESWEKKLTDFDPIILLCDESLDKYEGTMKVSVDGKNDMGLGLTVEFKITQYTNANDKKTGTGRSWIREWGDKYNGDSDWASWKIDFKDEKVYNLLYREFKTTGNFYTMDQKIGKCEKSKIKLKKLISKEEGDKGVENKDIRFDIDRDTCQMGSDSVTCDLVFASESKIEWVEGYKPKITYTRPSK